MRGILTLAINYFIISYVLIFRFEGCRTRGQFIEQHSKCPYIDPFIILITLYDLGRYVVDSATEGLPLTELGSNILDRGVGRPAEIGHFQYSVLHHNVFWFYVTMDDALIVHVLEGRDDLFAEIGYLLLAEFALNR